MFHRRGFGIAVVIGAVVLFGAGCEDPAPKQGSGKPGGGAPSASASVSASPQLVMPALVGQKFANAEAAVKKLTSTPVEARSAYSDVPLASDHAQWAVCFQTPAAGGAMTATTAVELSLVAPGTSCPEQAGATLRPSKAPAPSATPTATKPKSTPDAGGGSTGGGGGSVYYKNCDAAKAAGAAPIRRGQPGYRDALDRDKDGIACDK